MRFDELERYLAVAMGHSVTVDVRRCPVAPGVVRITTIFRGNRVSIVHDNAALYATGENEEWGPKYVGTYETIDVLVACLERYFESPIAEWRNYAMNPFTDEEVEAGFDPAAALHSFEELVRAKQVELPTGANFRIANIHWRHIAKYGEYRKDKLFEEQDEHLEEVS